MAVVTSRRSQAERRAATTRSLIAAARVEFMERGYSESSLASIASRAGVTAGAIQRHFRTKSELLVAVYEQVMDEERAAWSTVLTDLRNAPNAAVALVDLVWARYDAGRLDLALEAERLSRHDDGLSAALRKHPPITREILHDLAGILGVVDEEEFRARLNVVVAALRGLAVNRHLTSQRALSGSLAQLRRDVVWFLGPPPTD